jgi:hypothetical protein
MRWHYEENDVLEIVKNDAVVVLLRHCSGCILFVCFHGRPRQATDVLQHASLLYRPLCTFQLWPPDAPAPIDAFRTLAAEVGTYGRGIGPQI